MPVWSPPALGAAVFVALHYLLLRAASGRLDDRIGALVLETSAAVGVALSLVLGIRGTTVALTRAGLALAALALPALGALNVFATAASGLAISVASILLFAALRRGGPVGSTGTIALGGGVVLSAIAAPFLFAEEVTLRRVVGVSLGIAAMVCLSRE